MWLLLAFIAVPMIEIALFIQVGGVIGLGWTLLIVLLTAILGTYLVRAQGAQAIEKIKRSFNELSDPSQPLAEGAMILFSGALLLTPGFFTDAVGFALLAPPVRHAAFHWLRKRVNVQTFSTGDPRRPGRSPRRPDVIDGEFTEVDPAKKPTHHPSEWTKH
ncbi:MAG: FxsA family protein [Pseudooceanicola sp.]